MEGWFLVAWLMSIFATAAIHASDTHADVNLPGDQIWLMWAGLLLGAPFLWLAIRRRRRTGDDGFAGGLFDVLASLF
jgi:LPXTG-motif cell wall-anchored protein